MLLPTKIQKEMKMSTERSNNLTRRHPMMYIVGTIKEYDGIAGDKQCYKHSKPNFGTCKHRYDTAICKDYHREKIIRS